MGVAGRARFKVGSRGGRYWWQRRDGLVPQAATTVDLEIEEQRLGLWVEVASMGQKGLYGSVWFCDRDAGREVARFLLGIERIGRVWKGLVWGSAGSHRRDLLVGGLVLLPVEGGCWIYSGRFELQWCFYRWPRCVFLGIEVADLVVSVLIDVVFRWLESASWRRKADRDGPSFCFLRVLFFGFSLGQISPYSVELGLGSFVVSWLWWFSWGLIVSNSVCFCRQFADIRSLHVVWYVLGRGVEEGVVIMAIVNEVLSRLSGLFFISSLRGRFLWFEVGHFLLIWIVFNNLHVTNVISRVVRGSPTTRVVCGGDITACHAHVL